MVKNYNIALKDNILTNKNMHSKRYCEFSLRQSWINTHIIRLMLTLQHNHAYGRLTHRQSE